MSVERLEALYADIVNSRANPARDSRHNPASRNAESRSLNGWDF